VIRSPQKTLLLVEDEALLAMSERISLEQRGYAVKIVGSGEQAIEAVAGPGRIDLVLMDIDLGKGMDGTEAAARILERRDLPIVFLSSHTETAFVEKTESISSYGYVVKNSGITVLDASIKMAFKLHEAHGRIRESEEKYRHLHENADIGIGYYSPEGRVISYNAIAARNMGGLPEAFIGKSIFQLFPEAEARIYMDRIESACGSSEATSYEDFLGLPTGDRWFLSIFTKIAGKDDGVLGIQIISQDITATKTASLALGRDEAEMASLFDMISEGIALNECVYDAAGAMVDYRVLKVNRAFHSVADYNEGPIVGNVATVLYDMTPDSITEFWKSHTKKNEVAHAEYRSARKGRWFYVSTSPIVNDRFVTSFIDITDRKNLEAESRRSIELLKRYIDNSPMAPVEWDSGFVATRGAGEAPDGIFVVDAAGRFIDANQAACRLSGYAREELLCISVPDVSVYEPGESELAVLKGVLAAGSARIERRFRRKDGSIGWWSVDAIAMGDRRVLAMVRDISERKAIERTLQESEERLSLVLAGSELGYWDWDLATNIVKRDERWAAMLGYALSELQSTTAQWVELCHPDDCDFVWKSIQDHLGGRNDFYDIEYRMRTKDGRYRWIHDSGKIVQRDSAGHPLRACGTHRDITDEKENEGRIVQLLEEKELILREVHHRVKNSMNTMRSLVSLQRQSLSEPGAIAALLDVENRFNSMLVLYEKLNQSSSYVDVSIKPYLTTLIEEIVGNFPNSAAVRLSADIEDAVLGAKLAQTLGIILNELLTNVMKYAFAGVDEPAIGIQARLEDRRLRLRVGDNGIGMPEDVDFSRSSGFGLMLIGQLASQLGGTIRIERGEGTRVLLDVPA
jgi:PAS domain S-box-containing protein